MALRCCRRTFFSALTQASLPTVSLVACFLFSLGQDFLNPSGQFDVGPAGSKVFQNCLAYKLCYYRFGELRVRRERDSLASGLASGVGSDFASVFSSGFASGSVSNFALDFSSGFASDFASRPRQDIGSSKPLGHSLSRLFPSSRKCQETCWN